MEFPDTKTQVLVVKLILNKRTEESLQLLSKYYNIQPPEIVVGTIKGKGKLYVLYMWESNSAFMPQILIYFTIPRSSYMNFIITCVIGGWSTEVQKKVLTVLHQDLFIHIVLKYTKTNPNTMD